jgi:phytoene dehydrogenase-like protein
LELFSRGIATHNDLSLISTGETIRSLPKLLRGAQSLGYPVGGLSRLTTAYAEFIQRNRGTIAFNTPVSNIVIEDNSVHGVVVDEEFKKYPIVLSSIPVQQLFSITDESQFPSAYVRQLKQLIPSAGLCAYYGLKKIQNPDLLGKTFMFLQENLDVQGNAAFGLIDFKTACPTVGMAPQSRHLVQAYIVCTPKEARTIRVIKELKNILDSHMRILLADFDKQLLWALYPTTQQLEGVAKIITNKRPSVTTHINNLYLIGDCVKASDFGINCAINSAKKMGETL